MGPRLDHAKGRATKKMFDLTGAFLASRAASDFVTGTAIAVDGGYAING